MFARGTRLGAYEIEEQIGAGGMGEVYRAVDARLGRDVAIKIISDSYPILEEDLQRFKQESWAASQLNHPNVLTVYDIGMHENKPYLVTEILEGETLRDRLSKGPIDLRRTLSYVSQAARGIAAAHQRGIIHRDIKPSNLFLTRDGRIKVLDFGIAKLIHAPHVPERMAPRSYKFLTTGTGAFMGTPGYCSPEQVRQEPADHRSDIFALGAVLFELIAGRPAFKGETQVEILHSLLKEEIPDLAELVPGTPRAVAQVVHHCMEKQPDQRFQSALDVAFALEALAGSRETTRSMPLMPPKVRSRAWLLGMLLVPAAIGLAYYAGHLLRPERPPVFRRITYRRGFIGSARFTPDGATIIYGAQWGSEPQRLYVGRPETPEARPFDVGPAEIQGVTRSGQMAVLLRPRRPASGQHVGTLAFVPLAGGTAREIADSVGWADTSPVDGTFVFVRTIGRRQRLELSDGRVLWESAGWISHPRFSRDGQRVAFLDHPVRGDDLGNVVFTNLVGEAHTVIRNWSVNGLAWPRDDSEIWFSGFESEQPYALWAAAPDGKVRHLSRGTDNVCLEDISASGKPLIRRNDKRVLMGCRKAGSTEDIDLSWNDWSLAYDLSPDGSSVLFIEGGQSAGPAYGAYARPTNGGPAVLLGPGAATGLSPDGKVAVVHTVGADPKLMLIPLGVGPWKTLTRGRIETYGTARFMPDGRHVLFEGTEAGKGRRLYLQDIDAGLPRAITGEGVTIDWDAVSPDGASILAIGPDGKIGVYSAGGAGSPRPVSSTETGEVPVRWSADGKSIYVQTTGEVPVQVTRIDLATGTRTPWLSIAPPDRAGVTGINTVILTPDGRTYAYSYVRTISDLFVVDGLK